MGRPIRQVDGDSHGSITEEDKLRDGCYGLLGRLLCAAPDAELLRLVSDIDGDETPLGQALAALARTARQTDVEPLGEEFQDLFIGVGAGELNPYGSYYLTGFLYEKPLAKLRQDMSELGIVKQDDVKEPEDHIASLCEIMGGLIRGSFGGPADLPTQQRFFERHLAPWARQFFTDMEGAASARVYAPVGTIGRLFMEIETTAFEMAA